MLTSSKLPVYQDILAAAEVIEGHAFRTGLVSSDVLDEKLGARIFFKPECLQRTGSFKFRGAFNAMHHIPDTARGTGVLACSSGNHAQGIAEAARLKGYPATIIMPADAPKAKVQRTRRSGATVVEYDRHNDDREELTRVYAEERGMPIVHPFDNFNVIAGQGTAGLEISQDLMAMGLELDHMLVCAGGGGLLAGTLLSTSHHFPNVKVHPVEPAGYDDLARSHIAGERVGDNSKTPSVCDAIVTPMSGQLSFAICKGKLAEGLQVTDEEALAAVAFAFREMKLVVEPGGAVTLAALLAGKLDVTGKTVVATLSGGNIDADMMARALAL
ncbi:MAG: threonine/serine dehydratase [Rhizobiaceae bacterium]